MDGESSEGAAQDGWWFAGFGSESRARLLAAMYRRREDLLERYPRALLPAEIPTPLAALLLVWERWSDASGECPVCGGLALGTHFGGLLSIGGVSGTCTRCGAIVTRSIRGLAAAISGCTSACEGTEYRIPFRSFPGGWRMTGDDDALWALLGEMGETRYVEETE